MITKHVVAPILLSVCVNNVVITHSFPPLWHYKHETPTKAQAEGECFIGLSAYSP